MQYQYRNNVATCEQAVTQAITAASPNLLPMAVDAVAGDLLDELRSILTAELSTLFDEKGVAVEFNEAIEMAIRLVNGDLP